MKTQLKNIFDESTCLTRRQLKDYVSGVMSTEECHAAEHHLNDCPFCSEAVDGIAANGVEAIAAIGELNTTFLKEHFDKQLPQVHLNSLAPTLSITDAKAKRRKGKGAAITTTSVIAAILLVFGLFTYWKHEQGKTPATGEQSIISAQANTVQNN
jgi:anti-sigma factor RsiW